MSASARPTLFALGVGDSPEAWAALGFGINNSTVMLPDVWVGLGGAGEGITGWTLAGIPRCEDIDGLPTRVVDARPLLAPGRHANGALGVDHVVVITPDFRRTSTALERAGMPLRRIRRVPGPGSGELRQGFRRLGGPILELVERPEAPPGPARFWGLVITVADLDALAERLGDRLGQVKPAVQPGRRIATLRAEAGLSPAVAFMDPADPG